MIPDAAPSTQAADTHAAAPWAAELCVSASFGGTLVATKYMRPSADFRIGSSAAADTPYLTPSKRDFVLVESRDRQFLLRFEAHWQGWVWDTERMWTLQELQEGGHATRCGLDGPMEYPIPADHAIELQVGTLLFEIRSTPAVETLPRLGWDPGAEPLLGYIFALAAATLVLLLALPKASQGELALYDQAMISEARWVKIRSDEKEPSKVFALRPAYAATRQRPAPVRKATASLPEPIAETSTDAPAPESENQARTRAKGAGIVGLLEVYDKGAFMKMAAATQFDSSTANAESYGDLDPSDLDQKSGAWGHGLRKIGPGSGDGKDWGTLKAGDYKMASSSQRGDEYVKKALTRPHRAQAPAIAVGANPVIDGDLKYDVIRGQLGFRQRRFRLCFDEATGDVPWPGRILLQFSIEPSGVVVDASARDLADQDVRACVEEVLLSIRFPQAQDGKHTKVQDFPLRI